MRFFLFLLAFFNLPYCFAQTNPMGYFYKDRHEEAIPDFAALAVLEKQNCPFDIRKEKQTCTSRYRIIRILDAAPDIAKKKYIEAKDKPVFPFFRRRPVLIFGKHKNGHLQIEGYEETRHYFDNSRCYDNDSCVSSWAWFLPFVNFFIGDIYAFHSIGTPYYDIKNLDSIDMLFYNEYLVPELKLKLEAAGKDFTELLLRLSYNRSPIKAAKIENDFVALGAIKDLRPFNDPKRPNLYELRLSVETIFKNDAKIDSSIAILIDKARLPLGWGCQPLYYYLKSKIAFYFFGSLRDGSLVIDSLASTQDAFVFADTVYDISMGFPFDELLSYFLPSNMSPEEYKLGSLYPRMPDCLRNSIVEIVIKLNDYDDSYRRLPREKLKYDWLFFLQRFSMLSFSDQFRCREQIFPYTKTDKCLGLSLNEGVWGRKW